MKNKTNHKKLIIPLIVLAAIAAIFLIVAVGTGADISVTGSDVDWIIIVLLVILPVFLLVIAVVSLVGKHNVIIKADSAVNVVGNNVIADQNPGYKSENGSLAAKEQEESPAVGASLNAEKEKSENGDKKAKNTNIKRFCMLPKIDENPDLYKRDDYETDMTLEKLCNEFRDFSAYELKLYYDISDIRRFIAGLAVTKIIILQGMSGTGKTSLAYAFGKFLDNQSTLIPVQPMWKERTDLLGYYNEFTKRFNETDLLVKMYEALYSRDIYITVLDEMNIARVEYYFAEFLSLLELPNEKERWLTVVSDEWKTDPEKLKNGKINLPANMWFVGTANNDDSTFAISDKVYDRAMILNLSKKSEPFKAKKTKVRHIAAEDFVKLTKEAECEYVLTKRNENRLAMLDKYLIDHFHITFGNRIMKQIRSYVPIYVGCGGTELEALDDILAKKIMRKLEMQNPVHVKRSADDLCMYLDELFGTDKMPLCKEYIAGLKNNA